MNGAPKNTQHSKLFVVLPNNEMTQLNIFTILNSKYVFNTRIAQQNNVRQSMRSMMIFPTTPMRRTYEDTRIICVSSVAVKSEITI